MGWLFEATLALVVGKGELISEAGEQA